MPQPVVFRCDPVSSPHVAPPCDADARGSAAPAVIDNSGQNRSRILPDVKPAPCEPPTSRWPAGGHRTRNPTDLSRVDVPPGPLSTIGAAATSATTRRRCSNLLGWRPVVRPPRATRLPYRQAGAVFEDAALPYRGAGTSACRVGTLRGQPACSAGCCGAPSAVRCDLYRYCTCRIRGGVVCLDGPGRSGYSIVDRYAQGPESLATLGQHLRERHRPGDGPGVGESVGRQPAAFEHRRGVMAEVAQRRDRQRPQADVDLREVGRLQCDARPRPSTVESFLGR